MRILRLSWGVVSVVLDAFRDALTGIGNSFNDLVGFLKDLFWWVELVFLNGYFLLLFMLFIFIIFLPLTVAVKYGGQGEKAYKLVKRLYRKWLR